MEIEEHHKDFFSESDSEESDINVGSELPDIMGGIEKAFDHILEMRKRYLKALENYDEIDDEAAIFLASLEMNLIRLNIYYLYLSLIYYHGSCITYYLSLITYYLSLITYYL